MNLHFWIETKANVSRITSTFSVGAVDINYNRWTGGYAGIRGSNYNKKLNIWAPGKTVWSSFVDENDAKVTNKYEWASGTSMACPHGECAPSFFFLFPVVLRAPRHGFFLSLPIPLTGILLKLIILTLRSCTVAGVMAQIMGYEGYSKLSAQDVYDRLNANAISVVNSDDEIKRVGATLNLLQNGQKGGVRHPAIDHPYDGVPKDELKMRAAATATTFLPEATSAADIPIDNSKYSGTRTRFNINTS